MKRQVKRFSLATLAALALLLGAQATRAQQATKARAAATMTTATASEQQAGNNFHSSFASEEFAFNGSVAVEGAPFTAVGVKETTQVLHDGSRLVRRAAMRFYRDSAGRTRSERALGTSPAGAQPGIASIYDAPTGAVYFVNAYNRSALRLPTTGGAGRQVKVITPQSPPEDITRVVGDRIEPLGTQLIEGVTAMGVRVTSAIQVAGRADKVVYERWYSPELRRNVLVRCADPRFGEAVYRLTNIERGEQPATLFAIPADYKLTPFPIRQPERVIKSRYQN